MVRANRVCTCFAVLAIVGCGDDGADASGSTGQQTSGSTAETTSPALPTGTSTTAAAETGSATESSSGEGSSSTQGLLESSSSGSESSTGEPEVCFKTLPPADRPRTVVTALPFEGVNPSKSYTVMTLAEDGTLSAPGQQFEMGRSFDGPIQFTPDGRFGVAAQQRVGFDEDNSLGVFEVSEDGTVTVVEAMFGGSYYPETFTMSADGETLWVVDNGFPDVGGGIYEVSLGCDGTLTEVGLIVAGQLVSTVNFTSDGRALVGAHEFAGADPLAEAFLFDVRNPSVPLGSIDVFGHEEAVIQAAAVTPDDALFVLADNSTFAPAPNRVGFGRIEGDGITSEGTIDIFNPYEVVASPFGDVVLVASGEADAIFVLDYDPSSDPALTLRGELEYVGAPPLLPGRATMVHRGTLRGLVLWTENTGVRRIQFEGAGVVTDLGLHDIGRTTGGIGVQP